MDEVCKVWPIQVIKKKICIYTGIHLQIVIAFLRFVLFMSEVYLIQLLFYIEKKEMCF